MIINTSSNHRNNNHFSVISGLILEIIGISNENQHDSHNNTNPQTPSTPAAPMSYARPQDVCGEAHIHLRNLKPRVLHGPKPDSGTLAVDEIGGLGLRHSWG